MNKSSISDEFSEQFEVMTLGTPYAADSFTSDLERRIREFMYLLWLDGQAEKLANHLEQRMATHFEQLYEFSYGVPLYDTMEHDTPRTTETLALMIIDEKEAYKKQIERAHRQSNRFKEICDKLLHHDRRLFISYFERSEKVEYKKLRESVKHNLRIIESAYIYKSKRKGQQKKERKFFVPGLGYVSKSERELHWELQFIEQMNEMSGV